MNSVPQSDLSPPWIIKKSVQNNKILLVLLQNLTNRTKKGNFLKVKYFIYI